MAIQATFIAIKPTLKGMRPAGAAAARVMVRAAQIGSATLSGTGWGLRAVSLGDADKPRTPIPTANAIHWEMSTTVAMCFTSSPAGRMPVWSPHPADCVTAGYP